MNTTTPSGMFKLNLSDWQKGLAMAIGAGIVLPLVVVVQSGGFDAFHANWLQIADISATGAFSAAIVYLAKNYFSDSSGKLFGRIG